MSFSDGFAQGFNLINAASKMRSNLLKAEKEEEELRISQMSLSELESQEDITVGEQTALSNIREANTAA